MPTFKLHQLNNLGINQALGNSQYKLTLNPKWR